MTVVNNNSNAVTDILSQYNLKEEDKSKSNELGQAAFLELLVAQLNHQDPLSPQENGDFIAQLAQFSSVEGIDSLNKNFESFASGFQSTQALQASSLVGRAVHVESRVTELGEQGGVSIIADLPASTSAATLNITNSAGEIVFSRDLGAREAGEHEIFWTGYGNNNERLPAAKYAFDVVASGDGESEAVKTFLSANVNSVSVEQDGRITLNLAGIGQYSLSDVKQINR